MEKKEKEAALERKTSKRRSHTLFKRKSVKPPSAVPSEALNQSPKQTQSPPFSTTEDDSREMEKLEQKEKADFIAGMPPTNLRSIIPDALKDLPTWYNKEDWSPSTVYRTKYPIHNPVGPRYYRNYHLIPTSEYKPAARPPSVFSPSFPAMTSSFERGEDTTRHPGPSRTPSNSPLPTPSSSETRVADTGLKPRSRKTSQTAHDGVDLMDVSDPWGTSWHHQSPYDVGIGHSSVPADTQTHDAYSRSRRASMTIRDSRRKTVTPSPLSQSMSAIHLQTSDPQGSTRLPRKLSKKRAPIFGGWFSSSSKNPDTTSISPSDLSAPRSASALSTAAPSHKPERRASVLGRLAKRFSVVRRPPSGGITPPTNDMSPVSSQPSPEKQKRVPAPSADEQPQPSQLLEPPQQFEPEADRRSSLSVEAPYTIGKLMVANPDAPASEAGSPLQTSIALPNTDPSPTTQPHKSTQSHHVPSSSSPHAVPSPINNLLMEFSPLSKAQSRLSTEDKPLPRPVVERKPVERNMAVSPILSSPSPPASTKPVALPNVSDIGPPPPSATTKPIGLPDLSDPPPHSLTTKPIPLPASSNPLPAPPSATNLPISLPDEQPIPPSSTTKPVPLPPSSLPIPPSSTTKPVPLPPSSLPVPFPVEESKSRHSYLSVTESAIDHSPLSAASMLANPPTPHRHDDVPMPSGSTQPQTPVPARSTSAHSKRGSSREGKREPSPGISSVVARETETFKLVRSKSGNVYASNETIRAAGEQWEVVEDVLEKDSKSKARSISSVSNSKESRGREGKESRRESRRQEKEKEKEKEKEREREESEPPASKRTSKSSKKRQSIERYAHSQAASQSDSPAEVSYREETRRSRRSHDEDREREHRERKNSRRTTQSASPDKKQAQARAAARASSPNEPFVAPRASLERRTSSSARPTSEVPLVADLNSMKAKEAWEMERLYKGRSLYGVDPNTNGTAAPPPPVLPTAGGSSSDPTLNRSGTTASKGAHGSSHTSFMVSSPFSSNAAVHKIYPSSITSEGGLASFSSPEILSLPVSHNPLPVPPRDVTADYWTHADGVATSH
ncbi:hypothetical protein K435DRAFT_788517 [Dendrothele bispora CBS 962.96]|uniref:Uncharacterized protein n=1 Tax=Dendrothele bispora (strain CBS 962.96) TaxID=1314807 RepID=A0A4S8MX20_DENBC|nr:hypothetical protein K435DRAFT_788517 [Dendrothele bispora CBS 962.96]